tara:strand:+ start:202 stop:762 length:561 start_codon:yes stop_codon:yes gene_type:complete
MYNSFQYKLEELQKQYYTDNTKNIIFKSVQKIECANTINTTINKNELFKNTIYVINNTNKLYFDYPIFKTYASPSIFVELTEYIYLLIKNLIQKFNTYELHINWNTYSISAHERYKDLYTIFLNKYQVDGLNFHDNLNKLYVYFTPNIIQAISGLMRPLIHPVVLNKVILIDKMNSPKMINELFVK